MRFDMTEKPALKVIGELFGKTWRTNGEVTTNDEGRARFKGFYGQYDLTVATPDGKVSQQTLHLEKTNNRRIDGNAQITLTVG